MYVVIIVGKKKYIFVDKVNPYRYKKKKKKKKKKNIDLKVFFLKKRKLFLKFFLFFLF